jgi:hypothetical protein
MNVPVDELVVGEAVAKCVDEAEGAAEPRTKDRPGHRGELAVLVAHAILVAPSVEHVHASPLATGELHVQLVPARLELIEGDERHADP